MTTVTGVEVYGDKGKSFASFSTRQRGKHNYDIRRYQLNLNSAKRLQRIINEMSNVGLLETIVYLNGKDVVAIFRRNPWLQKE